MIIISVVIPTHNRKNLLSNCLNTLFQQSFLRSQFEIIVCDDGSTDGTKEVVKNLQKKYSNLKLLTQLHGGVSKARNLGIKKARGEIIAFTDDDCLPQKDWLKQIANMFQENPKILGVEGKTLTYPDLVNPFTNQIVNTQGNGYQTCNIAYQRKILRKVGGQDEHFRYTHCDDVDLALRVLKYGQIIFQPKAIVIHPPHPTSFLAELDRVKRITAELYLFLKHPDYFYQKYGKGNIFWQVVFINSIWIRLFHLKLHFPYLKKNPLLYLKFFLRTILEIGLIFILLPRFYLSYLRLKRSVHV